MTEDIRNLDYKPEDLIFHRSYINNDYTILTRDRRWFLVKKPDHIEEIQEDAAQAWLKENLDGFSYRGKELEGDERDSFLKMISNFTDDEKWKYLQLLNHTSEFLSELRKSIIDNKTALEGADHDAKV